MSKIGFKPIVIPSNAEVILEDGLIRMKGPQGELSREVPEVLSAEVAEGRVLLKRHRDDKASRGLHGLYRALLANMLEGVTKGFVRTLEIQGVGYRVELSDSHLKLLLGFSHPVVVPIPAGVEVKLEIPLIRLSGIDKELLGSFAALLRALKPVEVYKGKGIRYQDEKVILKPGKSAKGVSGAAAAGESQ